MQQQDDIAIIQLVLQGQQQAYAMLVERYQQYVFTLAMRYVKNRELAEELSQDVFVKAYRYLADFKGNSKFSTWLYTIVHNICLSHLRKKYDGAVLLGHEQMLTVAGQHTSGEKASDKLEEKTQRALINDALKYLPETDAHVISLFYQADQSLEEIGMITGMTANNVKVKLHRARIKLKNIMQTKFSRELA